jgi:hypothetical protein
MLLDERTSTVGRTLRETPTRVVARHCPLEFWLKPGYDSGSHRADDGAENWGYDSSRF